MIIIYVVNVASSKCWHWGTLAALGHDTLQPLDGAKPCSVALWQRAGVWGSRPWEKSSFTLIRPQSIRSRLSLSALPSSPSLSLGRRDIYSKTVSAYLIRSCPCCQCICRWDKQMRRWHSFSRVSQCFAKGNERQMSDPCSTCGVHSEETFNVFFSPLCFLLLFSYFLNKMKKGGWMNHFAFRAQHCPVLL